MHSLTTNNNIIGGPVQLGYLMVDLAGTGYLPFELVSVLQLNHIHSLLSLRCSKFTLILANLLQINTTKCSQTNT